MVGQEICHMPQNKQPTQTIASMVINGRDNRRYSVFSPGMNKLARLATDMVLRVSMYRPLFPKYARP